MNFSNVLSPGKFLISDKNSNAHLQVIHLLSISESSTFIPKRLAPERLAFVKSAPKRLAFVKSENTSLELIKFELLKSTFVNLDLSNIVFCKNNPLMFLFSKFTFTAYIISLSEKFGEKLCSIIKDLSKNSEDMDVNIFEAKIIQVCFCHGVGVTVII